MGFSTLIPRSSIRRTGRAHSRLPYDVDALALGGDGALVIAGGGHLLTVDEHLAIVSDVASPLGATHVARLLAG